MSEPGISEIPVKERPRNLAKTLHLRSVAQQESLRRENEELKLKSETDSLTGLHNRAYFDEQALKLQSEHARGASNYAVVVMDLDGFKRVNDKYGHGVGDEVLKAFAGIISNSPDKKDPLIRRSDHVARIGGDEFGVLMTNYNPDANKEDWVRNLEERLTKELRLKVSKMYPEYTEAAGVGVSVGIASPQEGEEFKDTLKRADKMVYARKQEKGASR
jgi:diguanylate cyclase (GGDEF)-like protein